MRSFAACHPLSPPSFPTFAITFIKAQKILLKKKIESWIIWWVQWETFSDYTQRKEISVHQYECVKLCRHYHTNHSLIRSRCPLETSHRGKNRKPKLSGYKKKPWIPPLLRKPHLLQVYKMRSVCETKDCLKICPSLRPTRGKQRALLRKPWRPNLTAKPKVRSFAAN